MRITWIIIILFIGVLLVIGAYANPLSKTPASGYGPAVFTTSDLTIKPRVVGPDEKVYVSVKVTNDGGQAGVYSVVLKVQNNASKKQDVQTQNVTLAGGTSQTVTFTISEGEDGTYTVMIDQLTGGFEHDPERA